MSRDCIEVVFRKVQGYREDVEELSGECEAALPVYNGVRFEISEM